MLYDIAAYPARVLAHSWEIPLVQLSPAMVAWEGYEQDLAEVYAAILDNPAGQACQSRFAAWLDEQEIALSVEEFIGRPPRCIVLIPRALQPHAEKVDECVYTFVGPSLDVRPHQGDWPQGDWPQTDRCCWFRSARRRARRRWRPAAPRYGTSFAPPGARPALPTSSNPRCVPADSVLRRVPDRDAESCSAADLPSL
ncbi:MAG: hypothetical protein ACRDTH_22520 [Pseudonocardiaceae bacterium]